MTRKVNSIRLVLEGMGIVALLAWGIYAVLIVSTSTSPSSPGGIANAVLRGSYVSTNLRVGTDGGTTIPPNTRAEFSMIFEANPTYNASKGWPQDYSVSGGEGMGWGPFMVSDPSSASSPYTDRYAIFTFSFSCTCVYWLSGPQDGIDPTYNFQVSATTWIVEVDSPGNYSIRLDNGPVANATGQVTMGYSSIVFTPYRPYLYIGLATIGVAIALSVATGLVARRKPETSQKPSHLGRDMSSNSQQNYD